MASLNERNEKTKKIIHIVVTELCDRNCPYCCNKQYNMNDISRVTDEELKEAEILFLTGGEPFAYTQPDKIAEYYKTRYSNIKKVFVYTNALELGQYIIKTEKTHSGFSPWLQINGLSISIKNKADVEVFNKIIKNYKPIIELESNRLYIFNNLYPIKDIEGFKVTKREWQVDFIPADDSIFRRM